jgi:hypothetical protein
LKEREEKRKNRDSAVSILRGISIRMPLLIYGADVKDEDKQINISNFTELIDEKSWDEFMPKGVTKQVFESFKIQHPPISRLHFIHNSSCSFCGNFNSRICIKYWELSK